MVGTGIAWSAHTTMIMIIRSILNISCFGNTTNRTEQHLRNTIPLACYCMCGPDHREAPCERAMKRGQWYCRSGYFPLFSQVESGKACKYADMVSKATAEVNNLKEALDQTRADARRIAKEVREGGGFISSLSIDGF